MKLQTFIDEKEKLNKKLEDGKITPFEYHNQVEELRDKLIKVHKIKKEDIEIKSVGIMVFTDKANLHKWVENGDKIIITEGYKNS